MLERHSERLEVGRHGWPGRPTRRSQISALAGQL
jgi:hypothetical protein